MPPRNDRGRAGQLSTKKQLLARFIASPSPRLILAVAAAMLAARVLIGSWGVGDLAVLVATVFLTGFVEWTIHRFFLHAPGSSRRMQVLKTGVGHREHHRDPQSIQWLLLTSGDAARFLVVFAVFTMVWSLPLLLVVGRPLFGGLVSAYLLAAIALANYEWTHLLIHSRYRPRTARYRRLAANHRVHHYRGEDMCFGVTSNLGDRVLGTLPSK